MHVQHSHLLQEGLDVALQVAHAALDVVLEVGPIGCKNKVEEELATSALSGPPIFALKSDVLARK